ncbi:MAG: DNA polymerase III subunit epsilon [Methylobacteriaceae bacterium]|nr:DNA polymerase III subunit epsilon [Methylobacteriaceae bacterium]MBV9247149.1 DNA polymerase III subunit epsilon [Methylobacteriaceae bacterium]
MREIVLDTETTGLDPADGHRVVEIGCVEVLNCIPTGQIFHRYLNPERDMPADALKVHGLSGDFLADKPRFAEIIDEFLDFLGDARLVVHNAEFDLRFLNAELARPQRPPLGMDRVLDTLALARRRHPGQPNSLDALCARYGIDASRRTTHGALLDAEILAEVYAELAGGRQTSLRLGTIAGIAQKVLVHGLRQRPAPLTSRLTQLEAAAHAAFVATFESAPLWNLYLEPAVPA